MELIENEVGLVHFVATHSEANFYLCRFVDYRSDDGFYRKYRFMFVGNEILLYHLAIGSHWKVHHASTDMTHQPWMQAEERAFIENPRTAFGNRALSALEAIRNRVGLDYFGIDCGLTRNGDVVPFEVNASMLVHLHNEQFPYKTPGVLRIKSAFVALLQRKVTQSPYRTRRLTFENPSPRATGGAQVSG